MKVILLRDVARLGRKSEIKEVPSGHATNFLIPRGLAIAATPTSLKRVEEVTKKHGAQQEQYAQKFKHIVDRLAHEVVVYPVDANEKGHLFKGIHVSDIIDRLTELDIQITKEEITLPHPLKELGTHQITLTHGSQRGVLTLEMVKK